jgi:peptidoglycan hydrolase-like protein with peptidoglycan-binding domain
MVASVQQTLKDKGFYYGEITGTKDADTTAAIRRYQIRNGLQITGELNAETQKSLGVKPSSGSAQPPTPQPTPRSTPPPVAPQPDTSDLRDDEAYEENDAEPPIGGARRYPPAQPQPGFDDEEPRAAGPDMSELFAGTPYEIAPPDVQQRVIVGTQSLLARRGYYRSGVDGIYGPGTEFALRAYQSRMGLAPTGRFDMDTLASLGFLPGQQTRRIGPPRDRGWRRRPPVMIPPQERIYIPR